jgi:hypothetical protein
MRFLLDPPSRRRVIIAATLGIFAVLVYLGSMACPRCAQTSIDSGRCHCWSFIPGPWWVVVPGILVIAYVAAAIIDSFLAKRHESRAA